MENIFDSKSVREKDVENGINDVIDGLIKSQERAKSIVANNEYILWLERFTEDIHAFADDSWLYDPQSLSIGDHKNVEELCSFYNGIIGYAERNFLPIYSDDYTSYVCIKFNNIGYEIGLVCGQGTYSYCHRVEISADHLFIDFNDIMTDKKQDHVDSVTETLDTISGLIESLLKRGVPIEAITTRVQDTINKCTKDIGGII